MSWVRIFATYAGEGDEDSTADKQETIILQAKINEDNRLDPISQYFGYTQELDEDSGTYEKYPFFVIFNMKDSSWILVRV